MNSLWVLVQFMYFAWFPFRDKGSRFMAKKPKSAAPQKKMAEKAEVVAGEDAKHPIRALRDEIDRLFESVESGMGWWPRRQLFDIEPFSEPFRRLESIWPGKQPMADVAETDDEFRVTAEFPGLEEKDVEVTLSEGVLTIKGEKEEKKEAKKKDYHVSERRFGMFQRSFSLPPSVDADKVQATMKNGVLSVVLPKAAKAKKAAKKVKIGKG